MSTAHNVQYPDNMVHPKRSSTDNWPEATIRSVAESIEEYAREKPLPFAAWAFGIGFILGWKLKPW
jgi:hypothetical protein